MTKRLETLTFMKLFDNLSGESRNEILKEILNIPTFYALIRVDEVYDDHMFFTMYFSYEDAYSDFINQYIDEIIENNLYISITDLEKIRDNYPDYTEKQLEDILKFAGWKIMTKRL